jgi:predicted XRE-type DNA-binding protein
MVALTSIKLMTRPEKQEYLARLRRWLALNQDTLKQAGIAERAGIDGSAMSHIADGTREPRQPLADRLFETAAKYGFDKELEYMSE